jgi:hypothetical protein
MTGGTLNIKKLKLPIQRTVVGLLTTAALSIGVAGMTAGAAHADAGIGSPVSARTGTESSAHQVAFATFPTAVQTSDWTPIAAYQTYWECNTAASWYPGYAYCSYVGGSYPWILWVWTW